MQLFDLNLSGNCYKVRLFLALIRVEYDLVPVDYMAGEHKSPEFLQRNPLGQIPVLTDGELTLRDSQAILVYLARRYSNSWYPDEPEAMAKIQQWLSTAANEIARGPNDARLNCLFGIELDLDAAQKRAAAILKIIDAHLSDRDWLELDHPTIADIACYPYIGLAPQGEISLEPYPAIRAWMERIQKLPGYITMPGL